MPSGVKNRPCNPDIVSTGRKRYVKKTLATVTEDLSACSKDNGLYWFHIASLKLTDPGNAPDAL